MTNIAINSLADVPFQDITKVSVDWLRLNQDNPRLNDIVPQATQTSLFA